MLTMTATESGSKELERLLAVIGARKDQAAFAALYSATKGNLFSTVLQIVKRSDLAEEIIQEAYVRIWRGASSYRSPRGSPMTWMITIGHNLAIDMVRKPAREIYSDDSELLELPADGPTALETIEPSEDQQTAIQEQHNVFSALQTLHPTRRDLIIGAYIHGESREQLSKRTGIPVNTIKAWIRRSLLEEESILRGKDKEREQVFSRAPQTARKNEPELATAPVCRVFHDRFLSVATDRASFGYEMAGSAGPPYASGDGPWSGVFGGWLVTLKLRERCSEDANCHSACNIAPLIRGQI